MRSTDILRHENAQILQALGVLAILAARAERGEPVPLAAVTTLVDFFDGFANRLHRAKKENALFPALEARGFPRHGGPLIVMFLEHEDTRALLSAVAESAAGAQGDAAARAVFAAAARAFDALLREHVGKENEVLLSLAERALDEADDARIAALFARCDTDELGPGELARLVDAAADFVRAYL